MKTPTIGSALLAALLLSGCVGVSGIVPNQSTMLEVRAKAGSPTNIRFDRNGDELWEYATGPAGYETYLLRFGTDGKLKDRIQLLTEERLQTIVPDKMTKADVLEILGRPSDQSFLRTGTAWSWRFRGGVQPGYLAVSFHPNGTVKERMVLFDFSDNDSGGKDE
jgi:hypothetical protein